MPELIVFALTVPVLTGTITMLLSGPAAIRTVNCGGSVLTSAALLAVVYRLSVDGGYSAGVWHIDYISAVFLVVIAVLSLTATVFSLSYMETEIEQGHMSRKMLPRYYALLNAFIFTMIWVLVVENLGLMWVAIEATTLASALLVAFYFNRPAIEAAWKYVMVCTVGICLALLGTILLYYAQVNTPGEGGRALSWLALRTGAGQLDPAIAKLALVFIIIGYGTKAGLAPMHTWLPDAHSQAPSPVSGLLSGALLSCALYAIVRNLMVLEGAAGYQFAQYLLIGFGVLSIGVAIPFVLVQTDIKRLLAYSSVEHMGIISLGLGIGTPLAVYGAFLHVLNHAVAKSALFYIAGTITQQYRTKHLLRIRGLVTVAPIVGTMFIIAMLAITGTPPFSIFISKFTIVWAAFKGDRAFLGWGMLILMAGVFAGMLYYGVRLGFGQSAGHTPPAAKVGWPALASMVFSVVLIIIGGLYLPAWLNDLLARAAAAVVGG